MRSFLVNVKTGLVIGGYSGEPGAYRFTPYTSAHGGSRKNHHTKAAASLRYTSPYCVDVDAESPQAAHKIAQERKVLFEAKQPCTACAHFDSQENCRRGAAPSLARTLQFCAKKEIVDKTHEVV